ncbi:hypothetical protein M3182_01030 [Mesobacillus maritimus]|uniref:hypothetical protein n=1 Tax=Mesobacillus maritimus TaxID=1643336 RepID=UPI00204094F0|nr:hypothetical protein [Mesobacillus maritimus]MCM3584323.1 hypothetical protein [Mesobacillus maritimus]MCM3669260.1 hypothetical protein [Mesobacillus maritimus]
MDKVIIVTFRVKGLPVPIKIASQIEPTINQIMKMVSELAVKNQLEGDIQFRKFLQEKEQKMYIYDIGNRKCMVLVEKLEKVMEFESEKSE